MTLRKTPTSTQRNARKRVSKDRGCILQRDDEVRERFRSKSVCRRSGRRREGGGENEEEEVDLHKRSWLGRASRVSPRGESERRKLAGTAWICPIGSLLARLFHGPGIVVTNVQTITATITLPIPSAPSHPQRAFVRFFSRRAGGLFYLRYLLDTRCIFNLRYYFIFPLLISAFVAHAVGTFFMKTSWK